MLLVLNLLDTNSSFAAEVKTDMAKCESESENVKEGERQRRQ